MRGDTMQKKTERSWKKEIQAILLCAGYISIHIFSILITFGILITQPSWEHEKELFIETKNMQVFSKAMSNATMIGNMIAFAVVMIPIIIYILYGFKNKKKPVPFHKIKLQETGTIISIALLLNFAVSFLLFLGQQIFKLENSSAVNTNISFIVALITSGILGPIAEEFLFRYAIIEIFKENRIKAIISSALLFGISHLDFIQGFYAFIIGLLLGYIYTQREEYNLLKCILLHIAINVSTVICAYHPTYNWAITGILVSISGIYLLGNHILTEKK